MDAVTLGLAIAASKRQYVEAEMYCDFSAMADGVPTFAQTGQAIAIYNNGLPASGMTVAGGKLIHGAPTAANSASYMEVALAAPWTRMGFRALFPGAGQVALIPWADPGIVAARAASQAIPNSPTHSVFRASDAHISKWLSGAGQESAYLLSEQYPYGMPSSKDGSWTWELYRDGNTVWCRRPDGTISRPISDTEISVNIGNHVCIELYESSTGSTPAQILEWWAQS